MNTWMIVVCVLAVIVVFLWVPLGAKAQYTQQGFSLKIVLGPISIPVIPKRPKQKEKKRHRKVQPEPFQRVETKSNGTMGSWKQFRQWLPLICQAAGELRRKIVIRHLRLHLVWAGDTPAEAAIGYGMVHGVVGGILALLESSFQVKDHNFSLDLDYERKEPQVDVSAVLSLHVGQILSLAVRYGVQLIAIQRKIGHLKEVNKL